MAEAHLYRFDYGDGRLFCGLGLSMGTIYNAAGCPARKKNGTFAGPAFGRRARSVSVCGLDGKEILHIYQYS